MDDERDEVTDPTAPAASGNAAEREGPTTLPIGADNLPRPPSDPAVSSGRAAVPPSLADEDEEEVTAVYEDSGARPPPLPPRPKGAKTTAPLAPHAVPKSARTFGDTVPLAPHTGPPSAGA